MCAGLQKTYQGRHVIFGIRQSGRWIPETWKPKYITQFLRLQGPLGCQKVMNRELLRGGLFVLEMQKKVPANMHMDRHGTNKLSRKAIPFYVKNVR